ncbi:MAG: M12 family metallo-peptidase [Planctomycetota bacterium]
MTERDRPAGVRPSLTRAAWVMSVLFVILPSGMAQVTSARAEKIRSDLRVESFELQELYLPEGAGGRVQGTIRLDGLDYWFTARPDSLRGDAFQVLAPGPSGELEPVDVAPPKTIRGTVEGAVPGRIGGRLEAGQLDAVIALDDGSVWTVQPLTTVIAGALPSQHVIYRSDEVAGGSEICGAELLAGVRLSSADLEGGAPGTGEAVTGNDICHIAFDADYEFYQKNGSSIDATIDDIELVLSGVETVYERDVQIVWEITTVIVRTSSDDPYTSSKSSTLLGELVVEWNENHTAIERDIAHLMTGKDIDGGVIGIAYVGVICNGSWGFGLSESRFTTNYNKRVALTAHELGHNFDSGHCDGDSDCHIMCAYINSCSGIGLPNFGSSAQSAIAAHRDSRSCLTTEYEPISLAEPFADSFESGLGASKWSHVDSATVTTLALAEPAGSLATNLDSAGSDTTQQDEIRSVEMLLDAETDVAVSFFSQHRGPESGEKLHCEYLSSSLVWTGLIEVVSDGSDQSEFVYHRASLPSDAYHDGFRLRFRVEGDEANDEWYLDCVRVFRMPSLTLVSPLVLGEIGQVDIEDLAPGQSALLFFSFDGTGSGPCFVQGTQCVGLTGNLYVAALGTADSGGTMSFQTYVHPAVPAGLPFYLQAFSIGDIGLESCLTNTLTAVTQN